MFTKDLQGQLTVTQLSTPQARTATFTSTSLDTKDYEGDLLMTQDIGAVAGTTPTLDGKLQDSADNSAWADVTGETFTQVTVSSNLQTKRVDKRVARRYVRYAGTIAGTSPSFTMSVTIAGQKKTQ